jgi:Fe-S-cluster containining protein
MKQRCKSCGRCCQYLLVDAGGIDYDLDWARGRDGVINGNIVLIPCRCKHLTEENKCKIHDNKPLYCKTFPERYGPRPWLLNLGCKYYEK